MADRLMDQADGRSMPRTRIRGTEPVRAGPGGGHGRRANSQVSVEEADKYIRAKIMREVLQAQALQLKIQQAKGELIPTSLAQADGVELAVVLVGALQSLPDRVAPELAAMGDEHDVHRYLVKEINLLIEEIRKKTDYK
jgi:hypothetical protein